jgi:Ni/Fe-hydrogenase subunit HybB-like protein
LVFFAITSSMSAWDWIMSIDTHWFSTLFGWYVFATMFVSALTALMMIVLYLKSKGYMPEVNKSHIHDIAKFMFAFSIFWTYLWFSQFMLIWYANIPEEVTYYMARFGEYKAVFFTMVVLNFIFPVMVLMSRDAKRNHGFIYAAGIVILFGHWLDIFIMIMPGSVGGHWTLGLVQIGTLLGFVGLFINVVFRSLAKAPLMPEGHPMFVESKHFHI